MKKCIFVFVMCFVLGFMRCFAADYPTKPITCCNYGAVEEHWLERLAPRKILGVQLMWSIRQEAVAPWNIRTRKAKMTATLLVC